MIIILIAYIIFFIIWLGGSVVAVYHNLVYYEPKSKMKIILMAYIWLSLAVFLYTFYLIMSIKWDQPLTGF